MVQSAWVDYLVYLLYFKFCAIVSIDGTEAVSIGFISDKTTWNQKCHCMYSCFIKIDHDRR